MRLGLKRLVANLCVGGPSKRARSSFSTAAADSVEFPQHDECLPLLVLRHIAALQVVSVQHGFREPDAE